MGQGNPRECSPSGLPQGEYRLNTRVGLSHVNNQSHAGFYRLFIREHFRVKHSVRVRIFTSNQIQDENSLSSNNPPGPDRVNEKGRGDAL